jgi:predicted nuclease with RNAse H fold
LRLVYDDFLGKDSDILQLVLSYQFELVAIDAPLSLPKGLCCLEESCSCQPDVGLNGRSCERELVKQGIGLFRTTKKSIIKSMVYRAIRLKTELESIDCEVIEVYPYASKIRLFGKNIPKKTTPDGIAFLRKHIGELLPDITNHVARFNHDLCDAAIAAYTAILYEQGRAEPCGDPEEGIIYLPLVDRVALAN